MDTGGTCKICMVTRRANQPGGVGRSVPRHRCPPLAVPCCCLVQRPDSESWHGAPPDVRGQLRSCMISEPCPAVQRLGALQGSNGSVCCNSSSKGSKGSRSSSSNNSKGQLGDFAKTVRAHLPRGMLSVRRICRASQTQPSKKQQGFGYIFRDLCESLGNFSSGSYDGLTC